MNKFYKIIFLIYVGSLSSYFLPLYTDDDQYLYQLFYNSISGLSLIESYIKYNFIVGASEPIYFLLIFNLHDIVDKNLLILILNTIFAILLYEYLEKNSKAYLSVMALTNFYFMALLFSHERLKLAIIIILLVNRCNIKNNLIKIYMPILAHFQMALIVIPNFYMRNWGSKMQLINKIIAIFISGVFFFYFHEIIIEKVIYYNSEVGFVKVLDAFIKIIFFVIIGIRISKKEDRRYYLQHQMLILMSAFFLGGDRLVIFSYGLLMHAYIQNKNNKDSVGKVLIFIVNFYFGIKGVLFLANVIDHGHGF